MVAEPLKSLDGVWADSRGKGSWVHAGCQNLSNDPFVLYLVRHFLINSPFRSPSSINLAVYSHYPWPAIDEQDSLTLALSLLLA